MGRYLDERKSFFHRQELFEAFLVLEDDNLCPGVLREVATGLGGVGGVNARTETTGKNCTWEGFQYRLYQMAKEF